MITGLAGRPGAPHRRSEARQQLVDPERLRHVVVGAGVERRHLLTLLADGGEDQDRDARPGPKLATHLHPAPVGQHEVEDHRLRRLHRRGGQRLLGRRGGDDLVAGAPQGRLERPQDLRLVVDDENPGRALTPAPSDGVGATGSASANDAPCPATDSTQTRPAFASTNPRAIARPSPAPRAAVAADAVERLEHPLELLLGQAGPVIDDPDDDLAPGRVDADAHGRLRAERT